MLATQVNAWLAADPDPADRAELDRLHAAAATDQGALADLEDRFRAPLRFGTAGLRGPLRAGPAGMNTAVVRRAAAGLAAWLRARADERAANRVPLVVVGYDARHRSEPFAVDSARVLAGAGLRALVLPRPLPTPVLAFAVRRLNADAGVMVTASHNPATDNGYKVYLGGEGAGGESTDDADPGRGVQLVAPADADIERRIAAVGPARAIPLADSWRRTDDPTLENPRDVGQTPSGRRPDDLRLPGDGPVVEQYVRAAAATALDLLAPEGTASTAGPGSTNSPGSTADPGSTAVVVYTPLHGVGGQVLADVFAAAGLPRPVVVEEQARPDPDFPTVRWPNPEEPGAMDRALALGERVGADVVLATDPDADRCAVAVGGRMLTGDEVGLLLADLVLRRRPGPVATTLVSSRGLRALAASYGVPYRETLTGFKWIMRADARLVFGYEEALGYAIAPDLVRDKDGITAALAIALLAGDARRRGLTLLDLLDELAVRIGVHLTTARSVRVTDPDDLDTIMRRLRAAPPSHLAARPVTAHRDLLRGGTAADDAATVLPPADVLELSLDRDRVIIRPSGTEPKLKIYVEAVEPVAGATRAGVPPARTLARRRLTDLTAAVDALLTGLP
ncbi:Phosphoglucomutase [Frankia canadensis]|uniref:Phosphoglucomutase n=1 Tax=Frankia canadensis TaxID=1836972 RepID=A0A2I2KME6_9ACTN|nr:Phosphoglucomutase [Frankia canadensis]SOU54128.1 Phosphoglucomutase [Frankia canadensis]